MTPEPDAWVRQLLIHRFKMFLLIPAEFPLVIMLHFLSFRCRTENGSHFDASSLGHYDRHRCRHARASHRQSLEMDEKGNKDARRDARCPGKLVSAEAMVGGERAPSWIRSKYMQTSASALRRMLELWHLSVTADEAIKSRWFLCVFSSIKGITRTLKQDKGWLISIN